jgi:hypothetical protein
LKGKRVRAGSDRVKAVEKAVAAAATDVAGSAADASLGMFFVLVRGVADS